MWVFKFRTGSINNKRKEKEVNRPEADRKYPVENGFEYRLDRSWPDLLSFLITKSKLVSVALPHYLDQGVSFQPTPFKGSGVVMIPKFDTRFQQLICVHFCIKSEVLIEFNLNN